MHGLIPKPQPKDVRPFRLKYVVEDEKKGYARLQKIDTKTESKSALGMAALVGIAVIGAALIGQKKFEEWFS